MQVRSVLLVAIRASNGFPLSRKLCPSLLHSLQTRHLQTIDSIFRRCAWRGVQNTAGNQRTNEQAEAKPQ